MSKTQAKQGSNVGQQQRFAQIPKAEIPRSAFDRSCGLKTTFDAGDLVPIFVDEALPGDTMSMNLATFARMATPLHPVMDNMRLTTWFFAIPMRLLWDNWKKFMGEQENPEDSTDYLIPTITSPPGTGHLQGSIYDHMGVPPGVPLLEHSAMFLRAYSLTWNEWFRDENLQDSLPVPKGDGPDSNTLYSIQKRGKRHDYFTSCLPFPQKGPAVVLSLNGQAPLGGLADVQPNGSTNTPEFNVTGGTAGQMQIQGTGGFSPDSAFLPGNPNVGDSDMRWGNDVGLYANMTAGAFPGQEPYADLANAGGNTINEIRAAFQVQRLLERDARGGTRYTEKIKSHFGVSSPDQRQQRPEYLGGGSTPLQVNPVAQTSSSDAEPTPQGNLAAFVTSASAGGRSWHKSFTEHCVIIGLASIQADLNYQQGLERMWSRSSVYDFYFPALSHLGEQPVLNKEIYAQGSANPEADEQVFGYQEAWAEMRYKPSQISGTFRSSANGSLDTWHLAQDFASLPLLNSTFIEDNPPIERVIAVPSEPQFLFDAFFQYRCVRPMPVYSVPGLVDHF